MIFSNLKPLTIKSLTLIFQDPFRGLETIVLLIAYF